MSPYQCLLILSVIAGVKPEEYLYLDELPAYYFDDFDACAQRIASYTYCFVKTVVRPREEDYQFSRRIKVDFRKSLTEWGVCLKECGEDTELLSKDERLELMQPRFPLGNMYMYPRRYYPEMDWLESLYGEKIHVCVNYRLKAIYNASGYPTIETCISDRYQPWKPKFDWFECIYYIIVFSYLMGFMLCNVLDLCGPHFFKGYLVIRAYSVRQNFVQLINWRDEEYDSDLRCINNLRFILTVLLVGLNCFLLILSFPVSDPENIEKYMKSAVVINSISCLFWIIPVFLTMDGFTMMVYYLECRDRRQAFDVGYFRQTFILWMIEIIPLYLVTMLYSTVTTTIWRTKPSVGRFFMLTREALCCRANLWANLLFLNNYPVTQEMCYVHTWYFAASAQLFLGAVGTLWVMSRYPTWNSYLKWIVPALAVCMPGIWVYTFGTEPLPPLRLNDISTLFVYQRWFRHMYIPTHMNAGSYIAGMIAGYYFYRVKVFEVNPAKFKVYQYIKRLALPITVAIGFLPNLFYTHDLVEPSLLSAGYAILFHNSCSIFFAICMFESFKNFPEIIRRLLATRFLVIPSRFWYGLFVTHIAVLRSYLALSIPTQEFDAGKFPKVFGRIFVLSFLLSIATFLVVEQPTRRFLSKTFYPNLPRRRQPNELRLELHDLEFGFGSRMR